MVDGIRGLKQTMYLEGLNVKSRLFFHCNMYLTFI